MDDGGSVSPWTCFISAKDCARASYRRSDSTRPERASMHELATIPFSRTSATDWSAISHERLRISERVLQGAALVKLSRRVDVDAALRSVIGDRPPAPGTWIANAETQWLWQGPREWLLISQAVPGSVLAERIATGLAGTTTIALEITDKLLLIDIASTASERLFSKGTSLDRALMPSGAC